MQLLSVSVDSSTGFPQNQELDFFHQDLNQKFPFVTLFLQNSITSPGPGIGKKQKVKSFARQRFLRILLILVFLFLFVKIFYEAYLSIIFLAPDSQFFKNCKKSATCMDRWIFFSFMRATGWSSFIKLSSDGFI